MTKATKAQGLYCYHPDVSDYTCGSCIFEKDANGKDYCALFGPSTTISEHTGSCNEWLHGEPEREKIDVPWLSLATKEQLGYAENANGFSCKRCANFIVGRNDCLRVGKDSRGDTPGQINPDACCSLWERSSVRGGLTNERLTQILAKKPAALKDMAGARRLH